MKHKKDQKVKKVHPVKTELDSLDHVVNKVPLVNQVKTDMTDNKVCQDVPDTLVKMENQVFKVPPVHQAHPDHVSSSKLMNLSTVNQVCFEIFLFVW